MHLISSMAYSGQQPWHGLGNKLAPNQPIEVWRQRAGLDWTIESSEVCFVSGNAGSSIGAIHAFPDQKVLYRSDTKAPLSVVSSRFRVVQPLEVLDFYRDLTEVGGFELETAGALAGGRKIWALAKTGHSGTLKGKDAIKGYLLLATACDGTLATTAQFTSVRVVCANSLQIALGDTSGAVKVSHRSQFDADAVKRQLGIAVSSWDTFMARTKALAERKVTVDYSDDRQLSGVFADLIAVREQIETLEVAAAKLKQTIQYAMGDASRALFDTGEVTFKRSKDGTSTDLDRLLADHPELAQQYAIPKAGSRRFLIYP